ncbi:hypothetical protein CI109_101698 [Kwoniella shandongensis]|uniref:Uncharacterized protein n=1 Tax=Kwoniella shandongensis TaxID=1734106 RepID=A0A5M6C5F4_9TREE|nr:uncharacterized protein CI109_001179 [Kwoniella shandongensis]KAA5530376.1 hypothetical protein CI109_001179 [Kwoniella shandongensis]
MSTAVTTTEEWVLGPENTPFYTKRWHPANEEPKACIIFVHGFAEHIARYDNFFQLLAAPPSSLHITAYDQRGHGRTSQAPLTATSPEVVAWKNEGKTVKLEKNGKRRTGGWGKVFGDMEWFVRRESERAKALGGKKLFLHGFSMGGGQVLAFPTRPSAPPSSETIKLLGGVISGGPLIRQTKPASGIQIKAGSMVAGLGLGSFLIPTPMDYSHLTHDENVCKATAADPFCEQVGSLRGVADMLNGGASLDSPAGWEAWPEDLPLLLYHGGADNICDPNATVRFGEKVRAKDKKVEIIEGMYHEVHNELEPVPSNLAKTITEWVHARAGVTVDTAQTSKL